MDGIPSKLDCQLPKTIVVLTKREQMILKTIRGYTPQYGAHCYFSENAVVVGEVIMGRDCSVWFNAVVRGDVNTITIGDRVNIQDGAVVHATYKTAPTKIGSDVSIGHNAIVHGCTIEDKVLVGMGSIIMDHCVVGTGSIIAAGSVLTQNTIVPPGTIYGGVPAKFIKAVDAELKSGQIERISKNYITYASWFKE